MKLADFGLARFYNPDDKRCDIQHMTTRALSNCLVLTLQPALHKQSDHFVVQTA
jgi:hypothetical protein